MTLRKSTTTKQPRPEDTLQLQPVQDHQAGTPTSLIHRRCGKVTVITRPSQWLPVPEIEYYCTSCKLIIHPMNVERATTK